MTDGSPTLFRRRSDTLRRVVEWMRAKRLDAAGKALLADAEAALSDGRGRPRVLTKEDAEAAVKAHGGVEAAARALGLSPTTVRKAWKG